MSSGAGPLKMPVRIAAAVLGIYMGAGGILLAAGALSTQLWRAALSAVVGLWICFLFMRAALSGQSPAWPDD